MCSANAGTACPRHSAGCRTGARRGPLAPAAGPPAQAPGTGPAAGARAAAPGPCASPAAAAAPAAACRGRGPVVSLRSSLISSRQLLLQRVRQLPEIPVLCPGLLQGILQLLDVRLRGRAGLLAPVQRDQFLHVRQLQQLHAVLVLPHQLLLDLGSHLALRL
jgi:hypothetical protein